MMTKLNIKTKRNKMMKCEIKKTSQEKILKQKTK
jgi:hypothetical protein